MSLLFDDSPGAAKKSTRTKRPPQQASDECRLVNTIESRSPASSGDDSAALFSVGVPELVNHGNTTSSLPLRPGAQAAAHLSPAWPTRFPKRRSTYRSK